MAPIDMKMLDLNLLQT